MIPLYIYVNLQVTFETQLVNSDVGFCLCLFQEAVLGVITGPRPHHSVRRRWAGRQNAPSFTGADSRHRFCWF